MEPGRPAVVHLGLGQTSYAFLPLSLNFVPGFIGCPVEVIPDLLTLGFGNATGAASAPLSIPALPWLAGIHLYAQVVVLGSVQGAMSPALDINLQ